MTAAETWEIHRERKIISNGKSIILFSTKNLRVRKDNHGSELENARKTLPNPYPEDENLKFIYYLSGKSFLCSVYPLSDYVNIQIAYRDFKKVEGTYLKAEIIL